jgi:peptidoglycan/LPS O-acetylase OafA/YrhL
MNAQALVDVQPDAAIPSRAGAHGRIDDIEILRAVAVIFVLIEHCRINLFPWMGLNQGRLFTYFGFWDGVDLFFAISGFVIARSLLPALAAADSTPGFFNAVLAFWVRRAWRLLPSAWLWLAVIMVCVVFFNQSYAFGGFWPNFEAAAAGVLDVANFRITQVFGISEPGAGFPYWSLSLEEQFYILLPIIAFLTRRWLPYVLGVGVLAQFFVTRSGNINPVELVLNQIRSDALLLGVLIAIWSRSPTYRLFDPVALKPRPLLGIAIFGFFVFLLAAAASAGLRLVSFQVGLVALISATLVLVASFDQDYLMPSSTIKRIFLWVGSRSYALYLIHIPVYCLTREIWFRVEPAGTVFNGTYTLSFILTAGALLLMLSELNYRFVEIPLRRRGARIAQGLAQRQLRTHHA